MPIRTAAGYRIEFIHREVTRRRKVDVQLSDVLACGVLDLLLLFGGQPNRLPFAVHEISPSCSIRIPELEQSNTDLIVEERELRNRSHFAESKAALIHSWPPDAESSSWRASSPDAVRSMFNWSEALSGGFRNLFLLETGF
jgi:hypothetical protein